MAESIEGMKERLNAMLAEMREIQSEIESRNKRLRCLSDKAASLAAKIAVEQQPPNMRNILVDSARQTWDTPRTPVVNQE